MVKDIQNSEHYTWGNNCDGWHLLKNENLNIICEKMPPGTSETRHYHKNAQQFFFILSGRAVIEIEGEENELNSQQGVHILPKQKHRIYNKSEVELTFLLISNPPAQADRYNIIK